MSVIKKVTKERNATNGAASSVPPNKELQRLNDLALRAKKAQGVRNQFFSYHY